MQSWWVTFLSSRSVMFFLWVWVCSWTAMSFYNQSRHLWRQCSRRWTCALHQSMCRHGQLWDKLQTVCLQVMRVWLSQRWKCPRCDMTGLHTQTHTQSLSSRIQISCVLWGLGLVVGWGLGYIHYTNPRGPKPPELSASSHTLRDKLPKIHTHKHMMYWHEIANIYKHFHTENSNGNSSMYIFCCTPSGMKNS